jgi:natural product precursor
MRKLKKLNLKDASLMTDGEMKMVTGGYSDHCLKGCTCSGGKTYYVSCDWNCSDAAKDACK